MADHDLVAELLGYRAELAHCEKYGKDERVGPVQAEIERVVGEVSEKAERLEANAATYDETGQGVQAAVLRNQARQFRTLIEDGDKRAPAKRAAGRGRKENAADTTPKERA